MNLAWDEDVRKMQRRFGFSSATSDMSVVRANISNIPIILCSATLSIETKLNILEKKYEVVKLKNRFGNAGFPEIKIVDLNEFPPEKGMWLSKEVYDALKKNYRIRESGIIFFKQKRVCPLCFL